MRSMFFVWCFLALNVGKCMSACFKAHPDPEHPNGCLYSAFLIPKETLVTVWYPGCVFCTCDKKGSLGCCDLYGGPVGFPDDCEVIWFGCERRAVKKNDHTIECKTNAMVG